MRRILWLFPVLLALAAVLPWASSGEAKQQPLVITGGALEDKAVYFFPDQEWYESSWVAAAEPTTEPAGPRYELYGASGGPVEMALFISEGSGEVLYPEAGLRHVLRGRQPGWYEISDASLAILAWVIEQAEMRERFGTLPRSPLHAYAEAYGLVDNRLRLFGGDESISRVSVDAMDPLLSLLMRGPAGKTDERFEFTIQNQVTNSTFYGYYDPPTETGPGRIKAIESPGTNFPTPYFETTEAFDKLIADALLADEAADDQTEPETLTKLEPVTKPIVLDIAPVATDDGGTDLWRWTTIGLTGLIVVMLTAGALTVRRRQKSA